MRRKQPHFLLGMVVRLAMLQVDHADQFAAAQDGHREKRLKGVLRQVLKALETRILSAFSAMATGSRCQPTHPVIPWPSQMPR